MSETAKLQAMIGNKQSEVNALHRDRAKLDERIARAEGGLNGLRDAADVIDTRSTGTAPSWMSALRAPKGS